ncbi:hypothetical protein OAM67_01350, partial [bacterium]|nr:hypothetical protein [bacterium]
MAGLTSLFAETLFAAKPIFRNESAKCGSAFCCLCNQTIKVGGMPTHTVSGSKSRLQAHDACAETLRDAFEKVVDAYQATHCIEATNMIFDHLVAQLLRKKYISPHQAQKSKRIQFYSFFQHYQSVTNDFNCLERSRPSASPDVTAQKQAKIKDLKEMRTVFHILAQALSITAQSISVGNPFRGPAVTQAKLLSARETQETQQTQKTPKTRATRTKKTTKPAKLAKPTKPTNTAFEGQLTSELKPVKEFFDTHLTDELRAFFTTGTPVP